MTKPPEARKGVNRRLTFTRTPFAAEYMSKLHQRSGLSEAELFNLAARVLAHILAAYERGDEYAIHWRKNGTFEPDEALRVLLGDVLVQLQDAPE